MCDSEEVKTLSKRKQRLSLGEASKKKKEREKEGKKNIRTSVIRPNGIEWPEYEDVKKDELCSLLKTLLKSMKLPNKNVPLREIRKVEPRKRAQFRREYALKEGFELSRYMRLRASVALGVNCVSKGLETGQLVGVIIEKDVNPPIITKLLIPIAEANDVPIVAIDGLNSIFKLHVGMRCIAFGFKRQCVQNFHHFHPIIELMESEKESKVKAFDSSTAEGITSQTSSRLITTPKSSTSGRATPCVGKRSKQKKATFQPLKIRKLVS